MVSYIKESLLPPTIHFALQIDLTSWVPIEELLRLSLNPFHQLVSLFGVRFLLLFTLHFYQLHRLNLPLIKLKTEIIMVTNTPGTVFTLHQSTVDKALLI